MQIRHGSTEPQMSAPRPIPALPPLRFRANAEEASGVIDPLQPLLAFRSTIWHTRFASGPKPDPLCLKGQHRRLRNAPVPVRGIKQARGLSHQESSCLQESNQTASLLFTISAAAAITAASACGCTPLTKYQLLQPLAAGPKRSGVQQNTSRPAARAARIVPTTSRQPARTAITLDTGASAPQRLPSIRSRSCVAWPRVAGIRSGYSGQDS